MELINFDLEYFLIEGGKILIIYDIVEINDVY